MSPELDPVAVDELDRRRVDRLRQASGVGRIALSDIRVVFVSALHR